MASPKAAPVPQEKIEAARAAWRAEWPLIELRGHPRFSHAQGVGRASLPGPVEGTPGLKGVHWLLLDRKGCLHVATVLGSPACLGSALRATAVARLIMGHSMKPQVSFQSWATPTRLPQDDRQALIDAVGSTPGRHWERADSVAMRLEAGFYREAIGRIVSMLDETALAAARGVARKANKSGLPAIGAYNVFAGGGAPEGVESAAQWRQQAAQAYPVFARFIRDIPELARSIDESSPLVASIARIQGIRPATVRALKGLPFGDAPTPTHLPWTIRLADSLPPDWMPRTPETWMELHRLARQFQSMGVLRFANCPSDVRQTRHAMAGEALEEGLAASYRLLADALRRNGRDAVASTRIENPRPDGPTVDGSLQNAVAHLPDAGLALCLEVVLPALAARGVLALRASSLGLHADLQSLGAELILAGRSPRAALRISRTHVGRHGAAGVAATASKAERQEQWWSPLGDDAVAPNGLAVHNLTTSDALQQEGDAMRHCVAGYSWICASGVSRIVGIRRVEEDGSFTSLSTAEIRVGGGMTVQVAQHRGRGNAKVGKPEAEALAWYLDALRKGEVRGNLSELAALGARADFRFTRVARAEQGVEAMLEGGAGYDWRDGDARIGAWRSWARLLESRAPTPEAWLAGIGRDVLLAAPDAPVRTAVRGLFSAGEIPAPAATLSLAIAA